MPPEKTRHKYVNFASVKGVVSSDQPPISSAQRLVSTAIKGDASEGYLSIIALNHGYSRQIAEIWRCKWTG